MEGGRKFLADVREALNLLAPANIEVERIDIYLGSNPLADCPVMAFRIRAREWTVPVAALRKSIEDRFAIGLDPMSFAEGASPSEKVAALSAATAAALLRRELRIGNLWGVTGYDDGSADCWIEFLLGAPAAPALKAALAAVAAGYGQSGEHEDLLSTLHADLQRQCRASRPNKMSGYLIDAARASRLPYLSLGRSNTIWQFGWGSRAKIFLGAACNDDGYAGFSIARNKLTAKHIFHELGLPTPRWKALLPEEAGEATISRVGFPCVVKPTDSSLGEGVTTNIRNHAQLSAAISLARRGSARKLIVERHLQGADHRLMVIDGRMFAAVRRDPPRVKGDGQSSVRELVEALNRTRRGRPEDAGFLSPVAFDSELALRLQILGLSLDTVPPAGVTFALRSAANRSAGGSATDVTCQVHPKVKSWAELLAQSIGLRVAGIDYISPDISGDPGEVGGGFIEINATPGLQVLAAAGIDRIEIGKAVLGKSPGRIPVDLVLAEPQAIDSELAALVRTAGHAIVGPQMAEVDGISLDVSNLTSFEIVGTALRHRLTSRCTIVWSSDDMTLYGLPVDQLRRTVIAGGPPPSEWLSMLRRISQEVGEERMEERQPALTA